MEDITDVDYAPSKRICKDLEIKKFKSTSWLVCSEYYFIVSSFSWELSKCVSWNIWTWPCLFPYGIRFSMASSLKRTKVKLDRLTDIDLLLMVEKCIKGICHSTPHWYAKANNKYKNDYEKIKNRHILNIGM